MQPNPLEKAHQGLNIEEEVATTVERVFAKYDTDGSGYLGKSEIWDYAYDNLKEIAPDLSLNYEELAYIFTEYDTNQDGMVTPDELAGYLRKVLLSNAQQ